MIALILLQKSAPHLINLFLPLLEILLFIFALNTLYEWLKTKPWKKDTTLPPTEETIQDGANQNISDDIQNNHSDLMDGSTPLLKPI
jgi:hypothetical protein